MKVRIVSKGWETFTGQIGPGAVFKNGESVDDLHPRVIARIGSSVVLENLENNEQVGPASIALLMQEQSIPIQPANIYKIDVDAENESAMKIKAESEAAEALAAAEALEATEAENEQERISEQSDVFYTREELEAIGSNDGISGLRQIASVHGVKGRSIQEMINEIIEAQDKKLTE